MSVYGFSHQDIDNVSYEYFAEKSLQYINQQTKSSEEALRKILEYLNSAVAFCRGESKGNATDGRDIDSFILFSQALNPQGSLKDFGDILAEYSNKIEALLAGDYSHRECIEKFLKKLRDTVEQMLLENDNKTRWRL